ncbi:MAG: SIS domain-containing protein [Lachnospiraceae bacterium]|nr:SIS domain-containing protein [uncultured Acetatifactor sp.]MCI9573542.1 SIS domain-containing protein [Lachnospiraceae bacterium]
MLYQKYLEEVWGVLSGVAESQRESIVEAARVIADRMERDGMLYVFGCGHSHLVGEDLFYRAGGSAAVCAMLDSDLMLHGGAVKSSCYERMPGLAKPIFERYGLTQRDVLMVSSTSGINSVPVEMAICAREKGIPVIAIVSMAYALDESRHPDGRKLHDVADIVLDNGVCHGDAAVAIEGSDMRVGPVSTISSCMIAQSILVQVNEFLWEDGVTPPVYVSGNIPGGADRNQALIHRYLPRNRHL